MTVKQEKLYACLVCGRPRAMKDMVRGRCLYCQLTEDTHDHQDRQNYRRDDRRRRLLRNQPAT